MLDYFLTMGDARIDNFGSLTWSDDLESYTTIVNFTSQIPFGVGRLSEVPYVILNLFQNLFSKTLKQVQGDKKRFVSLTRHPTQNPLSWILFHEMQMFTSLRCRSLCILLLRVYASLHTTQNPLSWILFHKMQMFTSLRCRSLCILLLRVYASLRTTQNPLSWILF